MQIHRHWALLSCLSAFAVVALATGAEAQLTSAQQSALKSNCRSDFMSKCSGVTPGGKDALACLQKNVDSLSAGCKSAVSATLPPPAPAAAAKPVEPAPAPATATAVQSAEPAPAVQPAHAPVTSAPPPKAAVAAPKPASAPTAAQQNAMKQACRSDFMAKCSGVTPGGKDALACLQRNVSTLSPSCKEVVSATMGGAPAAAAAGPAAVPAATAAAPTTAQQSAMKQACRSDFMAKCSGVAPGGKDALACLQRNVGTLSPSCKQVVSATMGGAPAAAAAAPAAAAPATGPTPQQLSAVKFTCRRDFQRYCKGVQAGGQEALLCLQQNAARLTPDCKTSLADIADSMPASAATPTAATAAAAAAPAAAAAATPRRLPPAITPAGRIIRRVIERNR